MPDTFVALAQWLRPCGPQPVVSESSPDEALDETPADASEVDMLLCEVRRFRAALADACQRECANVLREAVVAVLGRDLTLEPTDVAAIVRRICSETASEVLRVRVAPCDAPDISDVVCVLDESLRGGDAVIELRSGTIDARLGVRLAALLEQLERLEP